MKGTFELHSVDDVKATLTMTMNIGAWKKLRNQLKEVDGYTQYPTWQFLDLIRVLVNEVEDKLTKEVTNVKDD